MEEKTWFFVILTMALFSVADLQAISVYPIRLAVEMNDTADVCPLFRDVETGATLPLSASVLVNATHGSVTVIPGQDVFRRPAKVNWFRYLPGLNYTGRDSFQYAVTTSLGTADTEWCRIKVHPAEPGNMRIILLVNDSLLPFIDTVLQRFKTDLTDEGYSPEIHPYPNLQTRTFGTGDSRPDYRFAKMVWDTLVADYEAPGFVAGSFFFGRIPFPLGLNNWAPRDGAFWNLSIWFPSTTVGDTLYGVNNLDKDTVPVSPRFPNTNNIWMSRYWERDDWRQGARPYKYGDEALLTKRALDANHNYRKGLSRYTYHSGIYGWDRFVNSSVLRTLWDTVNAITENAGRDPETGWSTDPTEFTSGYDVYIRGFHASFFGPYDDITSQIRFFINDGCHGGEPGNQIGRLLATRRGGTVLGIGSAETAGSLMPVNLADASIPKTAFRAYLAAGKRWGQAWLRANMPVETIGFCGDFTLKPASKMGFPSNAMPVVQSFTADKVSGTAPLSVTFNANATDADGAIAGYEYFPRGHQAGSISPEDSGSGPAVSGMTTVYTKPYRYRAYVDVIDDYMAVGTKTIDIAVAPEPDKPFRFFANYYGGDSRSYDQYWPQYEFTDSRGQVWCHPQFYFPGTWGLDPSSYYTTNQGVGAMGTVRGGGRVVDDYLYNQSLNTCSAYGNKPLIIKVPLKAGTYTLRMGFADFNSWGKTGKMNITVNDAPWLTDFSPYQLTGNKYSYAWNVVTRADVTDSLLVIKLACADTSSLTYAFFNWVEIFPGDTALSTGSESGSAFTPIKPACEVSPNPFTASMAVKYFLPENGQVSIRIFNLAGQLVKNVISGRPGAGWHRMVWNGKNENGSTAASGWYLVEMRHGAQKIMKRALLVR